MILQNVSERFEQVNVKDTFSDGCYSFSYFDKTCHRFDIIAQQSKQINLLCESGIGDVYFLYLEITYLLFIIFIFRISRSKKYMGVSDSRKKVACFNVKNSISVKKSTDVLRKQVESILAWKNIFLIKIKVGNVYKSIYILIVL